MDKVHYWTYERGGDRNIRTFDISFSTDGGSSFSIPVSAASLNMPDWIIGGSNRDPSFARTATFNTLPRITNIRFSNLQNHSDNQYFALYEIRFGSAAGSGSTFAAWISGYEVGSQTAFADDFDKDGLPNGIESYFGTHPGESNASLLPGSVNPSETTFTFTHPINDSPASDVSAAYRWSKDLNNFYYSGQSDDPDDPEATVVTFTPGTPTDGMVTVEAAITGTPTNRIFVDIEVTQN